MRQFLCWAAALALLVTGCKSNDILSEVDPTIGGVGVLQPTRPTVQIPNQMIRWTPLRADMLDDRVADYPLTLASHRLQSVFGFLPLVQGGWDGPWTTARQVYDGEKNMPYEYGARLEGCRIRFAPSRHSGIAEVVFDAKEGALLRFRHLNGHGDFALEGDRTLVGHERFAGLDAYAWIAFDSPVSLVEQTEDKGCILLAADAEKISVRYGISYIDADQAKVNLEKEIPGWDLDAVSQVARDSWTAALGKIKVEGGTTPHRRLFYTSLYRCYERMVDISEYGRYYSAFDHQVHESDRPFYTDNWLWDTHISLEPLQTILNPAMEQDKLQSYVEMYRQSGTVPSFAVIFGDWPAMTGNYAAVWMADALAKGLQFDIETGFEGVRHNALEETLLPWRNGPRCVLDKFYDEHGWYPSLHPGEEETVPEVSLPWERRQSVGLSTAFAYCDWAVAQIARSLGKTEDEQLFLDRASWYRNVYRPDKGMFWPKDKDGNWIEGVDPRYMDRAYFTENNAYTFQWDVKHDLEGLFQLMGGRAEAEKKLDQLFRIPVQMGKGEYFIIMPDSSGMIGQFAMGNEPSFHIPYIYDYLGCPWKTQKRIHQVLDLVFSDTVSGIPGDEDGGGMSSFVVFSMMGFFPVTPGIPVYAIGSPFFEKTTISLPDGKTFTVKAKGYSEDNKYIQSARLNGKALDRAWFSHEELTAGGVLELTMGSEPNKDWGKDNLPPSRLDYGVRDGE
ncbi:MAG: glycoside hydrolase family 92 protein [Bacteroidales bacterium]|nr:glycoside hydrolase family 92 protein [Bacteroidales bacterium]